MKPAETHLRAPPPRPEGTIPPPVQVAPLLPKPVPRVRPETYSVVVHDVPLQELLFALARDAKLQVDISPKVTGSVTLNAIDQTLDQLLTRLARQVDIRHRVVNDVLVIEPDGPELRLYQIDYPNIERVADSKLTMSTEVLSSAGGGAQSGGAGSSAVTTITTKTRNEFWTRLTDSVQDILAETERRVSRGGVAASGSSTVSGSAQSATSTSGSASAQPTAPGGATAQASGQASTQASGQVAAAGRRQTERFDVREAARVFANSEAGVLFVRATTRQHAVVQRYIDGVMASARRQVLIEATVAEVQLNNQYQRGIDWTRLRQGATGISIAANSGATPAGINTNAFVINVGLPAFPFQSTIRLLESFGDVRVLSSPKISVLNNQTAVLKVVDNLVYFTIQANTTQNQTTTQTTFTTTPHTVPIGFIMTVVPQISSSDVVTLNLRPTISRRLRDVPDPNPSLAAAGVQSLIPVTQVREMESLLQVRSGQIAVLGGLMEDRRSNTEDSLPGLRDVPAIGDLLFKQRRDENTKTELVIFLRPTIIRDASVEGDFSDFRSYLPDSNYFLRQDPSRQAPPVLPGDASK